MDNGYTILEQIKLRLKQFHVEENGAVVFAFATAPFFVPVVIRRFYRYYPYRKYFYSWAQKN